MNRNLTAMCHYCGKITEILQGMIDQEQVTEENIQKLVDYWNNNEDYHRAFENFEEKED